MKNKINFYVLITFLFFLFIISSEAKDLRPERMYKVPLKGQALLLSQTFEAASKKYGVPIEILRAVGWTESRWDMDDGKPTIDFAYGVMGLRSSGDCKTLDRASELTGDSPERLENDLSTNIFGAAAVMADIAKQKGISPSSTEEWAPVVANYVCYGSVELRRSYIQFVFGAIADGMHKTFLDRSIFAVRPLKISIDRAQSLYNGN